MARAGAEIKTSTGGDVRLIQLRAEDGTPTVGDVTFALQRQRSRILRRTAAGLDYQEKPFHGYNKTRPFYYYPNGRAGKERSELQLKRDKAAVKRFARKLGRSTRFVSRSGLGIRFPSYADFKTIYLERGGAVDLTGPRAPNMLQGLVVEAQGGAEIPARQERLPRLDEQPAACTEGKLGIYGEAADRAAGHNSDRRPKGMPLRRFLASSPDDDARFTSDLRGRILERNLRKQAAES